jgi:hypothetical protein
MSSPSAGFAARRPDLGDDGFGRRLIGAAPVAAGPDIVDHDLGAMGGELQGIFAPDPARGTGDDGYPAVA